MPPAPEHISSLVPLGEAVLNAFRLISQSQYVASQLSERQVSADPFMRPRGQVKVREILDENRKTLLALRREPAIESTGATWDRAATGKALLRLVRSLAEEVTSKRTRSPRSDLAKVSNWIENSEPPQDQLLALGRKLQLRKKVRVLDGAARALVFTVPVIYARFRRKLANQGLYYQEDARATGRSSILAPLEADIVILLMLRNARRALQRLPQATWLQSDCGATCHAVARR
jgi:hypothetical protein